ncbi:MAG: O-antigen ligase family protein [Alphaproteobacteria bacterium]|nr:O-antigen ligase family protein [Alphaproteobacteria bacterium]
MTDGRIAGTDNPVRGLFGSWPGFRIPFRRPRRDVIKPLGPLKPFAKAQRSWYRPSRSWLLVSLLLLFCLIYGFAFAILVPFIVVPFAIPPMILLLLIIWAMPDATAPVRTMAFFFFAFFIGMMVWPNYLSIALPGLPWISIKRLTVFPLVLLLLYSISVSQEFKNTLISALKNVPIIWKAIAAFAIIETASVALSNDLPFSLSKLIVAQTEWTAIFFVSCYVFLKPGRPTRWMLCMWGAGIWVCAMGIWEYRIGYVPWRDHIPSIFQIDDPAVQRALAGSQRSALGTHRVQSVFTTSLGLSEFLALTIPFVMHFVGSEFNWKLRIAALISIPTFVFVIVISQSRLGLVGSLVSLLAFIFIWAFRRRIADKNNPFWTGILVAYPVISSLIVASTFFVGRIHARVWGNGPQQFSDQSRIEQWKLGIPKIISHPWGYGIGKGNESLGFLDQGGFGTIDSYYLLIALEYGIVGFVIYYGLIFFALYLAGKRAISPEPLRGENALLIPIGIALANFIVIKSVFAQSDNHPIVFMILGMLVALLYRFPGKHNHS